jgi:GNAT superfamily N-acetyltransferase
VPGRARLRTVTRMPRPEILPFDESHLPGAGVLLAERHRRHRLAQPLLAKRFEDPDVARAEVTSAWRSQDASGAVAVLDGRLVGYLLGAPKPSRVWGPNVWVESAGQAVQTAEHIRDLYGLAAARWVDEGRTAHYVLTPANDPDLLRAWFRLAFGQQHSHGIREVPLGPPPSPPHVTVRRAVRDDIPALARLELELPLHQGLSPTFSAGELGSYEQSVQEWEEDFDDPAFATFVAEHDGRVVGSAIGCPAEKSSTNLGLVLPDRAGFLGFAAVFPDARGLGAGRALGEAVLAWSAEEQHSCVVTDWRTTNLLSSRAWPALGFEESFVRLHRHLGY